MCKDIGPAHGSGSWRDRGELDEIGTGAQISEFDWIALEIKGLSRESADLSAVSV
jgi:hypothetical protein